MPNMLTILRWLGHLALFLDLPSLVYQRTRGKNGFEIDLFQFQGGKGL